MGLLTNKDIVRRFNEEVIERGNRTAFDELMAEDFTNHSAPKGGQTGSEGMWHTFQNVLSPALSGLRVKIHDQIAEDDMVTTRKTITGVHDGVLLGIPATHNEIAIDVIDIVRIRDGQYLEHWGINTLAQVLASLTVR